MKSCVFFKLILILGFVILSSLFVSADTTYYPPPDSQGGWRTLTSPDEILQKTGIDTTKLDKAFAYIQKSTKNGGLLVVRHGWLVYEKYFGKGHRDNHPNLGSCGKPFTSIAVGILMSQRPDLFPEGLDQKIFTPAYLPSKAFPLSDPAKANIKLGQLLSFSAGIRGNNPVYVNGKQKRINPPGPDGWQGLVDDIALGKREIKKGNTIRISAKTLWCDPGGGYSYATGDIHIASIMVRHITGMELEEYVRKHIAKPLGWGTWGYGYKYAKEVTHTPGGGGIALRATDMLRFQYMLLHEGQWKDRQIVPAEYIRRCSHLSPYNPHYPYSLQFTVNQGGLYPELPRDAYWKYGSGGHALYIVPSLDLIVWKLGGRDGQYGQGDTGLPVTVDTRKAEEARMNWKQSVDDMTAWRNTLKQVIDAVVK